MFATLDVRTVAMEAAWFSGRLKELRQRKGWTQQQLATETGVSQRAISHIEQGVHEPVWSTVVAICKALGVSCMEFLREPEPREATGPGRPKKKGDESAADPKPSRPRGRPKKAN